MVSLERVFDPWLLTRIGPLAFAVVFGSGFLSGLLKTRFAIRTNYSRKVFHFLVFSFAGVSAILGGPEGVFVYGGVAALFVLTVLLLDGGHVLYEGIAREDDAPHRSLYILVPFLATAAAGVLGNLWFGSAAIVGYVVAGWGDAVGEPVGVYAGRHPYRVPALHGYARRTWEGSLAVFFASFFGVLVAATFVLFADWIGFLPAAFAIAAGVTLVEAVTPRGLDNFTTQFIATALAAVLATGG